MLLNPELVGAIIVVMVFAILYELLKTVRELLMYFDLKRIDKKMRILRRISSSSSRENLVTDDRAQK